MGHYRAAIELEVVIKLAGGSRYMTVEIPACSTCASACAVVALMNKYKARVGRSGPAVGLHRPNIVKPDGTKEEAPEGIVTMLSAFEFL